MTTPERQSPPEALRARVMAAAARQKATPPGVWQRRLVLYGALAAAWVAGALALLGVRHDWNQLPLAAVMQTVGALGVGALMASAVGLARGPAMVGAPSGVLTGLLAGVPVLLLATVGTMKFQGQTAMIPADTAIAVSSALKCALLVIAVAVPLIGCAWVVTRGLILSRPALSGACVGLAAATWAHAVVRVHCAWSGVEHALVSHLLPAVPLMILGGWAFAARRLRQSSKRGSSERLPMAQS